MANSDLVGIPDGMGAEVLACTIIHCFVAAIAVVLRGWVRISNGAIGKDDYLMFMALVVYIICCIFAFCGCFSGLGATDNTLKALDPSGQLYMGGFKWFFFFLTTYMVCHPFIKVSICVALLRISKAKRFVIPLWTVIFLSVVTSIMGFGAILDQCHPITANWKPSTGQCTGGARSSKIILATSAVSILTDWLCAVLPAFLLWNLNMKRKTKVSLVFILALGALASISTCVRFPYLIQTTSHSHLELANHLLRAANITIWSVIECGIGIIAGSLPPLQPLFRRFGFGIGSSRVKLTEGNPLKSPLISSFRRRTFPPTAPAPAAHPIRLGSMERSPSKVTTTCEGGRSRDDWWEHDCMFEDMSRQKLIIMKNTQIDVEYEAAYPGFKSGR